MLDRILIWLIKRLVFAWDRNYDKLALSFGRDERTSYSVVVQRYFDDHYTVGTAEYQYPNCGADMREENHDNQR